MAEEKNGSPPQKRADFQNYSPTELFWLPFFLSAWGAKCRANGQILEIFSLTNDHSEQWVVTLLKSKFLYSLTHGIACWLASQLPPTHTMRLQCKVQQVTLPVFIYRYL